MIGNAMFTFALCGLTFSVLCYFLSSELRGDKDDKSKGGKPKRYKPKGDGPKELTIVDDKGNEYSLGEYLTKDEILKKDEFDIKPNTTYHKIIDKLMKDIKESINYEDMGRYRAILDVLESDQYRVQKRVVISSKVLEECIDYWPEAFDGVECLIDDNGNGIPDEAY